MSQHVFHQILHKHAYMPNVFSTIVIIMNSPIVQRKHSNKDIREDGSWSEVHSEAKCMLKDHFRFILYTP